MKFIPSGPRGEESEEEGFPSQKLGGCQLMRLKRGSSEGHEDQREVPLKEDSRSPGALSRKGSQKCGESGVMAHIREAYMLEG